MADYNTGYESLIEEKIKQTFDGAEIINPKNIKSPKVYSSPLFYKLLDKWLESHFYPEINKCDLFVYCKNSKGKITYGVKKELEYAVSIDKKVLLME